jgi:hypothetical protein
MGAGIEYHLHLALNVRLARAAENVHQTRTPDISIDNFGGHADIAQQPAERTRRMWKLLLTVDNVLFERYELVPGLR